MTLNISEIFYSIQGEGLRVGTANIFIRTQGCKAAAACYASGIRCDTEFESGKKMTLKELEMAIKKYDCHNIIWTGGEPAQQLTEEVIEYFSKLGYYQCIETSGLFPVPEGIDYVVVSPKVAEHVIKKNFPSGCHELRYVRHKGQQIPKPLINAVSLFISPHFDGYTQNEENIRHCIELVLKNPQWRLSIQSHKLLNVL